MSVVADSGPLIALAKIGGLESLFEVYPYVLTPPSVYRETVQVGKYAKAPDVTLLRAEYDAGRLRMERPQPSTLDFPERLGRGELECIQLSLQREAEWLLVDDLEARLVASAVFEASKVRTRVKGTLGIITSAYLQGTTSLDRATQLLDAIRFRKDIWVSPELCQKVKEALLRAAR